MLRLMRVLLLTFACLGVSASAAAAAESTPEPTIRVADQGGSEQSDSTGHSIVGTPAAEGRNNVGGFVVGIIMLTGWLGVGVVFCRQGRARRAAANKQTVPG